MRIEFPQYVNYRFFYSFILNKLVSFANDRNEYNEELFLDLSHTQHMVPSVICDLLCYLNYLHMRKRFVRVYILFGKSKKLSSYLNDASFFLLSENWRLFSTDLLTLNDDSILSGKAKNTNSINKVTIPPIVHESFETTTASKMPISTLNQIQKQIYLLYTANKATRMLEAGINSPTSISTGFIEIIENSYEHSRLKEKSSCYYTFQNYAKTGISFANSDIGMGFYDSLKIKFLDKHKSVTPQIFTIEEYLSFENYNDKKSLAAIIESIAYRLQNNYSSDFGFPFIFSTLIIPCNGILVIHSDNVLLEINKVFLKEYFDIEGHRIIGLKKDKLRSIVFDPQTRRELIKEGSLRIFDYSFPGVHMAVTIAGGT